MCTFTARPCKAPQCVAADPRVAVRRNMNLDEKIAVISGQRESVLRQAAMSASIVGAETMPAAQLAAALKAEAGGKWPVGVDGGAERAAEELRRAAAAHWAQLSSPWYWKSGLK